MVDIEITPTDIGLVVRFKRIGHAGFFRRAFKAVELTIVIGHEYEMDLLADYVIYCQLDEAAQMRWLKQRRQFPYRGRTLSHEDLAKPAELQGIAGMALA